MSAKNHKVVLITGAARRIGACIAEVFHENDYNVIVHYCHSKSDAQTLVTKLNQYRENSAIAMYADLDNPSHYEKLIQGCVNQWGRLDILMNNASTFTPTPIGTITQEKWDHLFNSNLKAPFFLSQAAASFLAENNGNIINIVDIHAITPMKNYSVYCCAKAGLFMLTKSLAMELAPTIRVNAIAPGNVIWPENENVYSEEKKQSIIQSTLLKKQVGPKDIAQTALFLANQTSITAQMIHVDAGRFSTDFFIQ